MHERFLNKLEGRTEEKKVIQITLVLEMTLSFAFNLFSDFLHQEM